MSDRLTIEQLQEELQKKEEEIQRLRNKDRHKCKRCLRCFNNDNRIATVFPCMQGIHVVCSKCIAKLQEKTEDYRQCVIGGEMCDSSLIHAKCPVCSEVNHFPRSSKLLTLPVGEVHLATLKRDIEIAKTNLEEHEGVLSKLIHTVVKDMNEHAHNSNISRLTGCVAGIAGGVTIGIGVALLVPSFGVSSALIGAGSALAGAGSAVGIGASIVESVIGKTKKTLIETELQKINHLKIAVLDALRLYATGCELRNPSTPLLTELTALRVVDVGNITMKATAAGGFIGLRGTQAILSLAADGAKATAAAVKGLQLATGVIAVILIPLDIFFVVVYSVDINKKKPSDLSKQMLEKLEKIKSDTLQFFKTVSNEIVKAENFRDRVFPQ